MSPWPSLLEEDENGEDDFDFDDSDDEDWMFASEKERAKRKALKRLLIIKKLDVMEVSDLFYFKFSLHFFFFFQRENIWAYRRRGQ